MHGPCQSRMQHAPLAIPCCMPVHVSTVMLHACPCKYVGLCILAHQYGTPILLCCTACGVATAGTHHMGECPPAGDGYAAGRPTNTNPPKGATGAAAAPPSTSCPRWQVAQLQHATLAMAVAPAWPRANLIAWGLQGHQAGDGGAVAVGGTAGQPAAHGEDESEAEQLEAGPVHCLPGHAGAVCSDCGGTGWSGWELPAEELSPCTHMQQHV
mmetsp:Transcript_35823/g.79752  ORF Transcript_35823/g.79752 Transcript_35823/m.79752 type:complete len:212 (-) Transcript_35823:1487-2122(-)